MASLIGTGNAKNSIRTAITLYFKVDLITVGILNVAGHCSFGIQIPTVFQS